MRRSTDPLAPTIGAARGRLRPSDALALGRVRSRPGITIGELRAALGVGRERIRQIVARLEWLGVVDRLGAPPRRLGPGRERLGTLTPEPRMSRRARTETILTVPRWRASIVAPAYEPVKAHQGIVTVLLLEHVARSPQTTGALSRLLSANSRTVRRILRRLELDGIVEHVHDTRPRQWRLASQGHHLGRRIARATPHPRTDA